MSILPRRNPPTGAGPFSLFFTNHGYSPDWSGFSLEEAIAQAKRYHFDAQILERGKLVGAWSAIGGYRDLSGGRRQRPYINPPEMQRGGVHIDIASHNPKVDSSLRKAVNFFREHAGYVVGRRMAGALDLARAERWAASEDVNFMWTADEDADLSWATPRQREQIQEVMCCLAALRRDGQATVTASLCGIVDPDRNYQRVVEAELANELRSQVE